jgi:hypothetical protein
MPPLCGYFFAYNLEVEMTINTNPQLYPFVLTPGFVTLLNDLLKDRADENVCINFRDPDYSAMQGGFHPVEIHVSSDGLLETVTDFAYFGTPPFVELGIELDWCFIEPKYFRQFDSMYELVVGKSLFYLWADHLRNCLEIIYQLCLLYSYGGMIDGKYAKIKVIVTEDSKEPKNIEQDIELAREYSAKGMQVFHFGQAEQYEMLQAKPLQQRQFLGSILTTQGRDNFYLKGQAANRNLSYLKFLQLTQDKKNILYYLVDNDQSFQVNRLTTKGDQFVHALNYFYYISRVFSETDTLMLTGKLVADPLVSPAVMASNFLDDVIAFFNQLSQIDGHGSCQFHKLPQKLSDDAAYHDMPKLFGFEHKPESFNYLCPLTGEHDNQDCMQDFRPGVKQQDDFIDLSNEFERQFFGDLMLFSVVELAAQTDFIQPLKMDMVNKSVDKVEKELLQLYQTKHRDVMSKNNEFKHLLTRPGPWWRETESARPSIAIAQQFTRNIDFNFGEQSEAYRQIQSVSHRNQRKQQIIQALLNYREQRDTWDQLFT